MSRPDRVILETVVDAGQATRCTECGTQLLANALVQCVVLEDGFVEETRCIACHEETYAGEGWLVEGTLVPSMGPSGRSRLVLGGPVVVE